MECLPRSAAASMVVPETPDNPLTGRRSRRKSTLLSTVATLNSLAMTSSNGKKKKKQVVAATPDSQSSSRNDTTVISESPFSQQQNKSSEAEVTISRRAAKVGIRESLVPGEKTAVGTSHPVFKQKQKNKKVEELSFTEMVPATQENLTPRSKVQAWLNTDSPSSSSKTRRKSSLMDLCSFLGSGAQASTQGNASNVTDSSDGFERELERIKEKNLAKSGAKKKQEQKKKKKKQIEDPLMFSQSTAGSSSQSQMQKVKGRVSNIIANLESGTEESDQDLGSQPRYRPPSFQDYSSESAKAQMAEFERKQQEQKEAEEKAAQEQRDSTEKPADAEGNGNESLDDTVEDEDLPPTQPQEEEVSGDFLAGIRAFVEVRTKNENRSECVEEQMQNLGATIMPKLGPKTTHLVFKDGSLATYNKAKKLGVHIVSVNWIEACKRSKARVPEGEYPTINKEKYDSPGLFPKLRKAKSMQPKNDDEIAKLIETQVKRRQKKRLDALAETPSPPPLRRSPRKKLRRRKSVLDVMEEYENDLNTPVKNVIGSDCSTVECPASPTSQDINTPLAKRIAMRLMSAGKTTPTSTVGSPAPTPRNLNPIAYIDNDDQDPSSPKGKAGTAPKAKNIVAEAVGRDEDDEEVVLNHVRSTSPTKRTPLKDKNSDANSEASSQPEVSVVDPGEDSQNPNATKGVEVAAKKVLKLKSPTSTLSTISSSTTASKKRPRSEVGTGNHAKASKSKGSTAKRAKKQQQQPSTKKRRHILFSQTSLLSETPTGLTPPESEENAAPVNVHNLQREKENNVRTTTTQKKKKARTVIHRDNSLVIARPPKSGFKKPQCPPPPQQSQKPTEVKAKPKAAKRLALQDLGAGKTQQLTHHPMTRRSSIDFVKFDSSRKRKVSILSSVAVLKSFNAKEIVCTSCHSEDVGLANQLAKQFPGKCTMASNVTARTTHVVCGDDNRRTLNVLRGILRGCWIVSKSWLFASLEAETWLDEEAFELVTFSEAVKARRLEREAFFAGHEADYKSQLLADVGVIYFGKECKAPRKDLADLVSLAGGRVANQFRLADVVVGAASLDHDNQNEDTSTVFVTEKWLLDSIQHHIPLPFSDYLFSKKN